jgi:hypothetical protein
MMSRLILWRLTARSSTAVPEGFSADYLRIYYGKLIRSLIMAWNGEDKLKQDRHLLSVHNYMFSVVIIDSAQSWGLASQFRGCVCFFNECYGWYFLGDQHSCSVAVSSPV